MKRPRQSAVRQNAGPLALFSFVVNVTASFFCQFSRHISTWEKELNRRRQTLKPLENQGFFRLSLLYRNGTVVQACFLQTAYRWNKFKSGWGTVIFPPPLTFTPTLTTLQNCPRQRQWSAEWHFPNRWISAASGLKFQLMTERTDFFRFEYAKMPKIALFFPKNGLFFP